VEQKDIRKEFNLSKDYLLVLGIFRLSEEKRPLLFLRVAKEVLRKKNNVVFLVLGEGKLEYEMKRYIEENSLQNQIYLLGARKDVYTILSQSNLLLLTSQFEGTPNVALEAQAFGIPVVACDTGGVRDCIIDQVSGYVVPVDDTLGLVEKCLELLNSPEKRYIMGQEGKKNIEKNFNSQVVFESLIQFIENQ